VAGEEKRGEKEEEMSESWRWYLLSWLSLLTAIFLLLV